MQPWYPSRHMTRVIVFPKPLFVGSDGRVTMKVRVAKEYRRFTFGHAMLNLLREALGSCPAPRVLNMGINVEGRRPEFVVQVVQVQPKRE